MLSMFLQSVYPNYMSLLKRGDVIYLGTNNPSQSEVQLISEVDQLDLALRYNRQHGPKECIASIGAYVVFCLNVIINFIY